MIAIIGLGLGAAFGWFRAEKRKLPKLDRLQYAAAHGIMFATIGIFVGIIIARL